MTITKGMNSMLRAILLYLSQAAWARRMVTRWPVAWRVASRFVAGETLDEAVSLVRVLNQKGYFVTLDHLGEYTSTPEEAVKATEDAIQILDAIEREGLRSGLSVKLSQIGMAIDESLCESNLHRILSEAGSRGIFLRIDMEDSAFVERTFALYKRARERFGIETVGLVLQSYLYRSLEDAKRLTGDGTRIRLVKGAYQEPEEVAFPAKKDVDAEFDRISDALISAAMDHGAEPSHPDGRTPPLAAIGSHDASRIEYARQAAGRAGLPKQALEFQMLNGIRRDLQRRLLDDGYPVRIYVPFGSEWYPYMVRRLAERPANLWFFMSNLLRR